MQQSESECSDSASDMDHSNTHDSGVEGACHLKDNLKRLSQQKMASFKRTRKGKVLKFTREKYLLPFSGSDSLGCGILLKQTIDEHNLKNIVSQSAHQHLVLLHTNVILQQIDALEFNYPETYLVVITQTALQDIRQINISVYKRLLVLLSDQRRCFIFFPNEVSSSTYSLRNAGEAIHAYKERLYLNCIRYYQDILGHDAKVIWVVDNNLSLNEKICVMNFKSYAEQFLGKSPEFLDLVACSSSFDSEKLYSRPVVYSSYLQQEDILHGLSNKKLFKGILRCTQRGSQSWKSGYVVIHDIQSLAMKSLKKTLGKDNNKSTKKIVYIDGIDSINRAVDGDEVVVNIMGTEKIIVKTSQNSDDAPNVANDISEPTPEMDEGISQVPHEDIKLIGQIVGIIKRNWRQYAGSIIPWNQDIVREECRKDINLDNFFDNDQEMSNGQAALFLPINQAIPKVIIFTRQLEKIRNQRVLIAIDEWPNNSPLPVGHFVRSLGQEYDKEVETAVLLHEHGIRSESFTDDVMACLPPIGWKITDDLITIRNDIRNIPVVSIDPPGCKDIDDALHCVLLPNGNYEVGVHIADVSFFVRPDTALDNEASNRSTSTYLVDRRLDMLPSLLTTELCSLRSTEDHLAFSVTWEMDAQANILDVKFFKSVIRSVASLTYDDAQQMIDERNGVKAPDPINIGREPVVQSVNDLNKIAKILRAKRIEQGALTLASSEVRFKFEGESDHPTDVSIYNIKESNQLVEEFMLLANITVAKKILRHYPTLSVLRRHQPPSYEQFVPLLEAAQSVGIALDISTSKTLADTLDHAIRKDDPYFNKLIRILSTKCMMPAQYFCSGELSKDQWHHYGLAAPVYTHFTSPIRRYADIIVHRLLAAAIGVDALPSSYSDRRKQQELSTHMNRRHKAAQHIQRASSQMYTVLYFRNKTIVEPGYVLAVSIEKLLVFVPRFGLEGNVSIDNLLKAMTDTNTPIDDDSKRRKIENSTTNVVKPLVSLIEESKKLSLTVNEMNVTFQVFQKILVKISVAGCQQSAPPSIGQPTLQLSIILDKAPNDKYIEGRDSNNHQQQEISKSNRKRKAKKNEM